MDIYLVFLMHDSHAFALSSGPAKPYYHSIHSSLGKAKQAAEEHFSYQQRESECVSPGWEKRDMDWQVNSPTEWAAILKPGGYQVYLIRKVWLTL